MFDPSYRSQEVRKSLGAGPADFLVGYFGLHGLFQGLDVVVEAADRLSESSDHQVRHGGRRPL